MEIRKIAHRAFLLEVGDASREFWFWFLEAVDRYNCPMEIQRTEKGFEVRVKHNKEDLWFKYEIDERLYFYWYMTGYLSSFKQFPRNPESAAKLYDDVLKYLKVLN